MASPFLTDDKKAYQWPGESARYERVTKILNDGGPQHWMKPWVAKEISEYVANNWYALGKYFLQDVLKDEGIRYLKSLPDQKRDNAAVRGTDIHYWMERITLGDDIEPPEHLLEHIDQGMAFLNAVNPEFVITEGTVFNKSLGYAGSFDAIIKIRRSGATAHLFTGEFANHAELWVLLDYKTGDKGAKDTYALQLTMYKNAEWLAMQDANGSWYKSSLPPIDLCCVLEINADKWRLLEMRTDAEVWECAKNFCGVAKWTQNVSRTVMRGTREITPLQERGAQEPPLESATAEGSVPGPSAPNPFLDRVLAHAQVVLPGQAFNFEGPVEDEAKARELISMLNGLAKQQRVSA